MKAYQAEHSIRRMCGLLGVSPSGYHAWKTRPVSDREQKDRDLTEIITEIWKGSDRTYGAPRVHAALADEYGIRVGRKRVGRLMRQAGIVGVSRRRSRGLTRRDPRTMPVPDQVDRDFTAAAPNRLWVSDVKIIPTGQGPLYLAAVTDVWSRRVVGWALRPTMEARLVGEALTMAITQRNPAPGLVFHSDQGAQYTSIDVSEIADRAGIIRSMGSVGDCYDNALAESLFATLETEYLTRHRFGTRRTATQAVFTWIEGWYNTHRRHSALDYDSPIEYERRHQPVFLASAPENGFVGSPQSHDLGTP